MRRNSFRSRLLAEAREQLVRIQIFGVDSARSRCNRVGSIETFMHAVVPHRVVVHVHSVNTIAWRRRTQSPSCEKLFGYAGMIP